MTQVRLHFDEDCSDGDVAAGLRSRSIDLTLTQESGLLGSSDSEQLEFAARGGRILCSRNAGDFMALHTEWVNLGRTHAGILIIAKAQWSTGEVLRRLARFCESETAEDMLDRAEFLSGWGAR